MALAEWGRWDDEIAPELLPDLVGAWIRRKRLEARLAMFEKNYLQSLIPRSPTTGQPARVVSASEFLSIAGGRHD